MPRLDTTDTRANGWSDEEAAEITRVRRLLNAALPVDHDPDLSMISVLQFAMKFIVDHADDAIGAKRSLDYMFDAYAADRWPDWQRPIVHRSEIPADTEEARAYFCIDCVRALPDCICKDHA